MWETTIEPGMVVTMHLWPIHDLGLSGLESSKLLKASIPLQDPESEKKPQALEESVRQQTLYEKVFKGVQEVLREIDKK